MTEKWLQLPSTHSSPGPQLAGARVTPDPNWVNPGIQEGDSEAEPVSCGSYIWGIGLRGLRLTTDPSRETTDQSPTDLGRCLTRVCCLGSLAVGILWENLLDPWLSNNIVQNSNLGSLFVCPFLTLLVEQVWAPCRNGCLSQAPQWCWYKLTVVYSLRNIVL